MPTSKLSIRQRDTQLRAQISRDLTLATLKDPQSWDDCWKPLLLINVILKQFPLIESIQDHPYIYERWWIHDSSGVNVKLLLTNEEGTSMVLLGTSVWDAEDSLATRWSEVSLQLQRFFTDCVNLFEGIRMRSVIVSCWDEGVKDIFTQGVMGLERSWRYGTAFKL